MPTDESVDITREDLPSELPRDSHDLGRFRDREIAALRRFKTPKRRNDD